MPIESNKEEYMYRVKLTDLIEKMHLKNILPDIDISEIRINQYKIYDGIINF